jgi:preprotein translocase subunit SecF
VTMAQGGFRNVAHRLYAGDISYDFIGRRKRWYALSIVVMLVSLFSLVFIGIKPSIDFKGGTQFELPGVTSISQAQDAMKRAGISADDTIVQNIGSGATKHIRITTGILTNGADAGSSNQVSVVESELSKTFKIPTSKIGLNTIGATWGNQITKKAIESLIVFLVVVVAYLSIRFQFKMAVAAIIALVHDLLITAGIYSLVGFEVSPATVVALLTILGYSLYDTVVVFDKVRENTQNLTATGKSTYSEAANLAVNQTLVRSINTSVVALLPIASILVIGTILVGAGTLEDLSLALLVGIATGTYSSIFIATPLLADLREREPEMKALRSRVLKRRAAQANQAANRADEGYEADGGGDGGTRAAGAPAVTVTATRAATTPRTTGPRNQPKRPKKKPSGKRR